MSDDTKPPANGHATAEDVLAPDSPHLGVERNREDRHDGAADGGPAVDLHSIGNHARRIRHDAATLAAEVEDTGADLERFLTERVRRRPFTTLGAAAGLGYLLGGGLRSPLTVMLLGAGTRLLAAQFVRELTGFIEQGNSRAAEPSTSANVPVA